MIHVVEVDLQTPGINLLVTPGDGSKGLEVPARTTSAYLREFGVQVAINGGFSEPFRAGSFLWDFYPHSGDPVDVTGVAISNGVTYSDDDKGDYPVLCIVSGHAEINQSGCPEDTNQALAGSRILVKDGMQVLASGGPLHPRTAVAVDREGDVLWLIVIDGRQARYSEGATLSELAEIVIELGADRALNLDGGGSSTLVMASDGGAKVLNAPIHTRVPMRERPVANHLGVYAHSESRSGYSSGISR